MKIKSSWQQSQKLSNHFSHIFFSLAHATPSNENLRKTFENNSQTLNRLSTDFEIYHRTINLVNNQPSRPGSRQPIYLIDRKGVIKSSHLMSKLYRDILSCIPKISHKISQTLLRELGTSLIRILCVWGGGGALKRAIYDSESIRGRTGGRV